MTSSITEDGEDEAPFFRMVHDGVEHESNNLTSLVAQLINGTYAAITEGRDGDEQALLDRWQQAVSTANLVQAIVITAAVNARTFDVKTAGEDILTLLFADRIDPVEVDEWDEPVPLILISTSYAPFTDRMPPIGNIRWINPHTERTYLETLADLGVIEFGLIAKPAAQSTR